MTGVRIRGDGVAALCAAHLLNRAGVAVLVEPGTRPQLPCILLSQASQELIRDVFSSDVPFRDAAQIHRRVVEWGSDSNRMELPHCAAVVSEESLLAALGSTAPSATDADWTIDTTVSPKMHRFGERMASIGSVREGVEPGACWMKSLDEGWEFLISAGNGSGWRIFVRGHGGDFPAAPRIAAELCGPGWLACGSAAIGFDPLCGDGTAHAIREAILATAVIRAAMGGEDPEALLAHYRTRLMLGFQRHLSVCREFYRSGGSGPWWRAQCADLDRGLAWCADQLRGLPPFQYRLEGFELHHLQPGTANDPMRVVDDVAPLFK